MFDAANRVYAAEGGAAGLRLQPGQIGVLPDFDHWLISIAIALSAYDYRVWSFSGPDSIRKNAFALPAYAVLLGLIALLGVMAHAAGISSPILRTPCRSFS